MPLKNILVHLDGTPESPRRLRAGIGLAHGHDAHLTALFVVDTLFPFYNSPLKKSSFRRAGQVEG